MLERCKTCGALTDKRLRNTCKLCALELAARGQLMYNPRGFCVDVVDVNSTENTAATSRWLPRNTDDWLPGAWVRSADAVGERIVCDLDVCRVLFGTPHRSIENVGEAYSIMLLLGDELHREVRLWPSARSFIIIGRRDTDA